MVVADEHSVVGSFQGTDDYKNKHKVSFMPQIGHKQEDQQRTKEDILLRHRVILPVEFQDMVNISLEPLLRHLQLLHIPIHGRLGIEVRRLMPRA